MTDQLPQVGEDGDDPIEAKLEMLPADQREIVVEIAQEMAHHSGPLPSPRQMVEYEAALPGLAERIVRLTENEQKHRHTIQNTALNRSANLRDRGQWLALVAMALVLAFCAYLVVAGATAAAASVAIALVAAVVGIFVTGRHADIKESASSRPSSDD